MWLVWHQVDKVWLISRILSCTSLRGLERVLCLCMISTTRRCCVEDLSCVRRVCRLLTSWLVVILESQSLPPSINTRNLGLWRVRAVPKSSLAKICDEVAPGRPKYLISMPSRLFLCRVVSQICDILSTCEDPNKVTIVVDGCGSR